MTTRIIAGPIIAAVLVVCLGCMNNQSEPFGVPTDKSQMIGSWTLLDQDSSFALDTTGDHVADYTAAARRTLAESGEFLTFTADEWYLRSWDRVGGATCYRVDSAGFELSESYPGQFYLVSQGSGMYAVLDQKSAMISGDRLRIRHYREDDRDGVFTRTTIIGYYGRYQGTVPPADWPSTRCP